VKIYVNVNYDVILLAAVDIQHLMGHIRKSGLPLNSYTASDICEGFEKPFYAGPDVNKLYYICP
jgi:hypothetical protein